MSKIFFATLAFIALAMTAASAAPSSLLPYCNSLASKEAGLLTDNLKDYVVFAGSGYTFSGPMSSTFLNGNIASFPTATALSGNTMVTLNGLENLNAIETNIAAQDVITTYNNGVAKDGRMPISGDIGGSTKTPGVYFAATTIGITGNLTLDAQGDSNAVFIFVAGTALFNGAGTHILLLNGAQACHVYWIVGSSASINTNTNWIGTVNAYASITVAAGSTITGHLFARQAVTIGSSTVSLPSCSASIVACETPAAPGLIDDDQAGATFNSVSYALMVTIAVLMTVMGCFTSIPVASF